MWFLNIYLQYGLLWISVMLAPLIACNWITNLVVNFLKRRKSMKEKVVLVGIKYSVLRSENYPLMQEIKQKRT